MSEFPTDWTRTTFGNVLNQRKEADFTNEELLAVTSSLGIVKRDSLERRDTSNEDKSKYLLVNEGDIAYNTMRMWQGVSGVSRFRGIVSPAYTICTPKEGLDANFAGYLLKDPEMVSVFRQRSQGLVSDTWNLKYESFAQIACVIPPLPEQKKIAEILSGIDKTINKILEVIAKAETTLTGVFANLDLIASSGKTATLGEVAMVQNGYAFQSSIFSEDPADIPLVRISNISGGGVNVSKSKRIPRTLVPSDEYKVNRGDILIAMSGATTGKIGKYQGDAFCLLNQRVGKFVFRPGSDSAAFATQLLLSGFLESRILAKAAGGAQPNISGKGIENIDIPFPGASDQEKYGSVIKELLQVNSRRRILVEKYQHLKASISSDLLSGRKRVSI